MARVAESLGVGLHEATRVVRIGAGARSGTAKSRPQGWIDCGGAASLYGDREKSVTVYAGDGAGGAISAFSDAVFDVKLEGSGAATKLWLTTSGRRCGKPPAPDFAHESFCDRRFDWNAKTRTFEYAPLSTVRMIE